MATHHTYIGVKYKIEKGLTRDTHPGLIYAPEKIESLEKQANDMEWSGKDASAIRREIESLKATLDISSSGYVPLF